MAIEPINGFYVHDEATDTDGVAKVSIDAVHEFVEDVSGTVENWLDEHPEATTTVQDGAITNAKLSNELQTKSAKIITTYNEYVAAISDGVNYNSYVCGTIPITSPIVLTDVKQCIYKSFSNAVFDLQSNMFEWASMSAYHNIPSFVNCTFIGHGYSIVKDGAYILRGKFVNCTFIDCSLVNNGYMVQSAKFVNCNFANAANIPFINSIMVYDTSFVNCQAEYDNKSAIMQATAGTSSLLSVERVSFRNCIFESQSTNVVEMIDGTISFDGCYTESNTASLLRVNATAKTNPRLQIWVSNTKLHVTSGVYSFNIDASFENSDRSCFVCTTCDIYRNLINTSNFKKYVVENQACNSESVVIASLENSRIKSGKNSVANFNVSKHILVYKYPCIVTFTSMVGSQVLPFIYFISSVSVSGEQRPYVVCLNDTSATPTAVYDTENNRIDVTMHTNGNYSSDGMSAVFLQGVTNNFNVNDYWKANLFGYNV